MSTFYLLQGPPTPQTSSTRNTASPAERSRYSSRLLLDIGLPPFQSRSYRVYQMPCITGALSLLLMECLFITAPFVPLLTAFLYLYLLACICRGKGRHLKFHELSRKDTVLYPSTIEIGEPKRKADSAIQYLCTCIQLHAKSRPALNLGIPKSKYVCLSYSKPRSNKNLSRLFFFSPPIVIEAVSSLDGYAV